MAGNFGVNLSTGKLSFPVVLGTISGPNGFGETVSLEYNTSTLLQQIQTWNEDSTTSVVGLGWSLSSPLIMRVGNGSWQDSFYLVAGDGTFPLLLASSPLINTKDEIDILNVPFGDIKSLALRRREAILTS